MLSNDSILERHRSLLVELDSALRSLQADTSTRMDKKYSLASVIREGDRPVNVVSEDLWRIIVALQVTLRDGLRRSARGVLGPFVPLKAEGAVSFWPYLRDLLPKRATYLVNEAESVLRDDLDRELAALVQALNEGTLVQFIEAIIEDTTTKQRFYSSSGQAAVLDKVFLQELRPIVETLSLIWFEVELEEVLSIRKELERLRLDEEIDEDRIIDMAVTEPRMGVSPVACDMMDPLRAAIPAEPAIEPPPMETRRQSVFERMRESLFAIIGPEVIPENLDDLSLGSSASMSEEYTKNHALTDEQAGQSPDEGQIEGTVVEEPAEIINQQVARETLEEHSATAHEEKSEAEGTPSIEETTHVLGEELDRSSQESDDRQVPSSTIRSQISDSLSEGHPLRQSLRASKQLDRRPSLLNILDEDNIAPGATNRLSIIVERQARIRQ